MLKKTQNFKFRKSKIFLNRTKTQLKKNVRTKMKKEIKEFNNWCLKSEIPKMKNWKKHHKKEK